MQYPHFVINLFFLMGDISQILFSQMHVSFFLFCVLFPNIVPKFAMANGLKGNLDLEAFEAHVCPMNENNFNFLNEEAFLVSLPLHMIMY